MRSAYRVLREVGLVLIIPCRFQGRITIELCEIKNNKFIENRGFTVYEHPQTSLRVPPGVALIMQGSIGAIILFCVPIGLAIILLYKDFEIVDVDCTVGIDVAEQVTFR